MSTKKKKSSSQSSFVPEYDPEEQEELMLYLCYGFVREFIENPIPATREEEIKPKKKKTE